MTLPACDRNSRHHSRGESNRHRTRPPVQSRYRASRLQLSKRVPVCSTRRLRAAIPDFAIRAFLVQSLDVAEATWRLNLKTLEQDMPAIMGFPDIDATFEKPTMFLAGGASDYVLPEYRDTIRRYFPTARMVKIPGANHWLHAEKPREFEAAVDAFLDRT